ncbi:MAG: hypothetical protein SBU_000548 [Candidatus Syntrophoarchaeum butanivorans]|uniref:Uncharacterized protein n=1 Tax=Candidatus Syntropharchaeum butanivorans TaxID=1839936 RepID=A0A1F2P7C0_9EURY|nr:MAG: hypothetical protein SBU_000548 [Candidatus Syntrophoarchaeum butanivorans]
MAGAYHTRWCRTHNLSTTTWEARGIPCRMDRGCPSTLLQATRILFQTLLSPPQSTNTKPRVNLSGSPATAGEILIL